MIKQAILSLSLSLAAFSSFGIEQKPANECDKNIAKQYVVWEETHLFSRSREKYFENELEAVSRLLKVLENQELTGCSDPTKKLVEQMLHEARGFKSVLDAHLEQQSQIDKAIEAGAEQETKEARQNRFNIVKAAKKKYGKVRVGAGRFFTTIHVHGDVRPIADKSTVNEKEPDAAQQARRKVFDSILESAQAKDWQKFIQLIDQYPDWRPYAYSSFLSRAIEVNAPDDVFMQLTARGASFQPFHTSRAVLKGDVALLQRLMPMGLDVHANLKDGNNAVNVALFSMQSKEMFDFLLENDVKIRPGKSGKAPLTLALEKALLNVDAVHYVFKLIQRGEKITEQDYALVEQLKQKNAASYELIKERVPELILQSFSE